jgi:hypothetical protein
MKPYWRYEIQVDGRCVCSAADECLSKAISRAVQDCVYYQCIYPAAKIVIAGIEDACDRCHNDGSVCIRKPRSMKRVKCPACNGNGSHNTLLPIPFMMPDSANHISLVQDFGQHAEVSAEVESKWS